MNERTFTSVMNETFIETIYRPNRLCCATGAAPQPSPIQPTIYLIHLDNGIESMCVCIIARSGKWNSAVVIMLFIGISSGAVKREIMKT